MKLFTQVSILLSIMFVAATFLSFAGDSDLKDADSKKIMRKYILYPKMLEEPTENEVPSLQDCLLNMVVIIAVGIGASVLARIVGEGIVGEGVTKKSMLGAVQGATVRAVERVAVGAGYGALSGGGIGGANSSVDSFN